MNTDIAIIEELEPRLAPQADTGFLEIPQGQ
jgi:hypothetical protein